MTSKTQPESQQHWDTHIKAYLSSKLSMKKYCQQKELVYHRFQYQWDRYRRNQKKQIIRPEGFAKVALTHGQDLKQLYEIRCPNGVKCWIPEGLNKAEIIKLMGRLIA